MSEPTLFYDSINKGMASSNIEKLALDAVALLKDGAASGGSTDLETKTVEFTENTSSDGTTLSPSTGKDGFSSVTVKVAVPAPSGTKEISITQNGTTTEDVSGYANAEIVADVHLSKGWEIDRSGNGYIATLYGANYCGQKQNVWDVAGLYRINTAITSVIIKPPCNAISASELRGCGMSCLYLPNTILSCASDVFRGCSSLQTPMFESGFNCSVSFYESPNVTRDAVLDIIEAYANNSGKTLTLHATAYARLQAEDFTAATAKGLTIASA